MMNKINLALAAVLMLIASYIAADIFWLFASPEVVVSSDKPNAVKNQENLVLANDIFGGQKIIEVKKAPVKVVETKLNLDLIGILFKREKSLAIIAPSNSHALAKTYQVDDDIKTGVSVKEIGADFVILQRGKKLEKLIYKHAGSKEDGIDKVVAKNKAKLSTKQKEVVNDYRAEIASNPRKLLSIVSVIPTFKNGRMLGVKVKPDKDKQIFNALGFKSGDIITKVNHTLVNNFNKFAKIRQIIYTNSSFDLKIKRNNKTVYLSIQL
ncbi:MAG: hypothetical protein HAW67_00870 [Endozoicomonadaceae bacterium]|nr:hypothetical protein [Endozoicomonadaceae bacterium]